VTAAADKWHWRTSSSTATGVGPNLSTISSSPASSAINWSVRIGGQLDVAGICAGVAACCVVACASARPSCESTSSAPSVKIAPCRMRSLEPRHRGSSGDPGTANTSRPCSSAKRAVISEPERAAASTTTTPSAIPEIIRLRRGKCRACGSSPAATRRRSRRHSPARRANRVFRRIDDIDAAGNHRDAACFESSQMSGGVDPTSKTGNDDDPGAAE